MKSLYYMLIFSLLGTLQSIRADILFQDDFSGYVDSTNITGQTGAGTGETGTWQTIGNPAFVDSGILYSYTENGSGNASNYIGLTDVSADQMFFRLDYIHFTGDRTENYFRLVDLDNPEGEYIQFLPSSAGGYLNMHATGVVVGPDTLPQYSTWYTLIGVADSLNNQLALFINPTNEDYYHLETGDTSAIYVTNWTSSFTDNPDNGFDSFVMHNNGTINGNQIAVDNIVLATTPGEVGLSAVPEPTSSVLVLGSLGLMALRRRQR